MSRYEAYMEVSRGLSCPLKDAQHGGDLIVSDKLRVAARASGRAKKNYSACTDASRASERPGRTETRHCHRFIHPDHGKPGLVPACEVATCETLGPSSSRISSHTSLASEHLDDTLHTLRAMPPFSTVTAAAAIKNIDPEPTLRNRRLLQPTPVPCLPSRIVSRPALSRVPPAMPPPRAD